MRILVAIGTERELNFEQRCVTGWKMTLRAVYGCMLVAQGEACPGMIGGEKLRGLPSINGVAAFASAFVGTGKKLSGVRIGLVAVCAVCVRNRRFEITGGVTRQARHVGVFAEQGEACL